jgi:predicted Zn-dependent peptidase
LYSKSVLKNGLRVITSSMQHTRSVCISIFIGAGSRYEGDNEAGVSHFVEHLCFKGTRRRITAKEIAETIDGVGGLLNGGTDKEFTVYWSKVASHHFPLALDLLADMIRYSRFDVTDIERERSVIIEELNESNDSPQDRVNRLIDEVLWPKQPLGREVIGSKETVGAIGRDMLLDYLGRNYRPNNTVVSVAGDIGAMEVVQAVDAAFGDWEMSKLSVPEPARDSQKKPQLCVERRSTEQAHICLAIRGLPLEHPDRFNLDILNVILGGSMSSRLHVEIRERLGLAYDIYSYPEYFLDAGAIVIYAGVAPKNVADTIKAVIGELEKLKDKVPEVELTKAKELVKGRLLLSMEDSRSVAGWVGGQEVLSSRIRTVDDFVSIVDAITPEDLKRVSQQLFLTDKLNVAIVGPVDNEARVRKALKL